MIAPNNRKIQIMFIVLLTTTGLLGSPISSHDSSTDYRKEAFLIPDPDDFNFLKDWAEDVYGIAIDQIQNTVASTMGLIGITYEAQVKVSTNFAECLANQGREADAEDFLLHLEKFNSNDIETTSRYQAMITGRNVFGGMADFIDNKAIPAACGDLADDAQQELRDAEQSIEDEIPTCNENNLLNEENIGGDTEYCVGIPYGRSHENTAYVWANPVTNELKLIKGFPKTLKPAEEGDTKNQVNIQLNARESPGHIPGIDVTNTDIMDLEISAGDGEIEKQEYTRGRYPVTSYNIVNVEEGDNPTLRAEYDDMSEEWNFEIEESESDGYNGEIPDDTGIEWGSSTNTDTVDIEATAENTNDGDEINIRAQEQGSSSGVILKKKQCNGGNCELNYNKDFDNFFEDISSIEPNIEENRVDLIVQLNEKGYKLQDSHSEAFSWDEQSEYQCDLQNVQLKDQGSRVNVSVNAAGEDCSEAEILQVDASGEQSLQDPGCIVENKDADFKGFTFNLEQSLDTDGNQYYSYQISEDIPEICRDETVQPDAAMIYNEPMDNQNKVNLDEFGIRDGQLTGSYEFSTEGEGDLEASFGYDPSSPSISDSISFDASADGGEDDSLTYSWDWTSDGTYEGSGQTDSNSYSSSGDYDVTLKVEDGNGGSDTSTQTLSVTDHTDPSINNPSPTSTVETDSPTLSADFSDNEGLASYTLDLDGSQVDSGTGISGNSDSASYDASGLSDGSHTFNWSLTDNAGNSAWDQKDFSVEIGEIDLQEGWNTDIDDNGELDLFDVTNYEGCENVILADTEGSGIEYVNIAGEEDWQTEGDGSFQVIWVQEDCNLG